MPAGAARRSLPSILPSPLERSEISLLEKTLVLIVQDIEHCLGGFEVDVDPRTNGHLILGINLSLTNTCLNNFIGERRGSNLHPIIVAHGSGKFQELNRRCAISYTLCRHERAGWRSPTANNSRAGFAAS
jgi:hypothetical protein